MRRIRDIGRDLTLSMAAAVVGLSLSSCSAHSGSTKRASQSTPGTEPGGALLPPGTPPPGPQSTAPGPPPPGGVPPPPPLHLPPGFEEAPNAGPASLSGSANQPFSGLVVAVGSGRCGCSANIDWGDGSNQSAGKATANDHGGVDVTGTHTYQRSGTYHIVVYVMLCATECHGPLGRDAVQQTISVT